MKRYRFLVLLLFTVVSMSGFGQSANTESDNLLGIWLTGSKKAKVEIYRCGGKYCGKIVWLREPTYEDGTAKIDKKNSDEKKRSRPILGMDILTDFEYDEDLEWEDGEIYDPENGKTYSCEIWMEEKDKSKLNVRGYVGFSLLGRTDIWVRSELN